MPVAESVSNAIGYPIDTQTVFTGGLWSATGGALRSSVAGLIGLGRDLPRRGTISMWASLLPCTPRVVKRPPTVFESFFSREILERFHSTTDVSAAFLKSAVYGEFSETVLGLFETGRPTLR